MIKGFDIMLYVAYGSNMNLEQMKYRCPNSKVVGKGVLKEYQLVFNVHADVIETNYKTDKVPVVLWDINDYDWHYLDMYEGFPSYYIKKIVPIEMEDGRTEHAIVYVMADKRKGICPPDEHYFNVVKQGCIDNGIDVEYLYKALQYSID